MPQDKNPKSNLRVVRTADGWAVVRPGALRSGRAYRTQAEAIEAAKEALQSKGGELRIQGSDGRWRESFTVGRDNLGKISAVEGIRVSRDVGATFREFDRRGLSADQRRAAIAKKFARKS